jgi:hypothetical protein
MNRRIFKVTHQLFGTAGIVSREVALGFENTLIVPYAESHAIQDCDAPLKIIASADGTCRSNDPNGVAIM